MNSMTYKIKYLPLAVQDLNDIARYLSGILSQNRQPGAERGAG